MEVSSRKDNISSEMVREESAILVLSLQLITELFHRGMDEQPPFLINSLLIGSLIVAFYSEDNHRKSMKGQQSTKSFDSQ